MATSQKSPHFEELIAAAVAENLRQWAPSASDVASPFVMGDGASLPTIDFEALRRAVGGEVTTWLESSPHISSTSATIDVRLVAAAIAAELLYSLVQDEMRPGAPVSLQQLSKIIARDFGVPRSALVPPIITARYLSPA